MLSKVFSTNQSTPRSTFVIKISQLLFSPYNHKKKQKNTKQKKIQNENQKTTKNTKPVTFGCIEQ